MRAMEVQAICSLWNKLKKSEKSGADTVHGLITS